MNEEKIMPIIQQNVHDVLDKYLTGKLEFTIEREIVNAILYDLANLETEADHD